MRGRAIGVVGALALFALGAAAGSARKRRIRSSTRGSWKSTRGRSATRRLALRRVRRGLRRFTGSDTAAGTSHLLRCRRYRRGWTSRRSAPGDRARSSFPPVRTFTLSSCMTASASTANTPRLRLARPHVRRDHRLRRRATVVASGLTKTTTIDGVTIQGASLSTTDGRSTYAVFVHDSTSALFISNSDISPRRYGSSGRCGRGGAERPLSIDWRRGGSRF